MKLYYFQRRNGLENFGDSLNAWLFPHLLPDFFNEDETVGFIGFGTLLNDLLAGRNPRAKQLIIFSTGVGYGNPLEKIPETWKICCVRGPLSAKALGLPEEFAVADGAILTRRFFQPDGKKTARFSFMPHINNACSSGDAWQEICDRIGFQYIDPRWSVERVLTAIAQTEVLLTEAMHGAIVGDALRVPWLPIVTSPKFLKFKWQDWCFSVGLTYRPYYLPPAIATYPRYARGWRWTLVSLRHWGKSLAQSGLGGLSVFNEEPAEFLGKRLLEIAHSAEPQLSSEPRIEQLSEELERRLKAIPRDNPSDRAIQA